MPPGSTDASSDYYNACAPPAPLDLGIPANMAGYQFPAAGNAYAGIYLYMHSQDAYPVREYLMTPLSTTLAVGEPYTVSLKVVLAEFTNTAVNSLGVYFSTTPLPYSSAYPSTNANIPVMPQHTFPDMLTDSVNWTTLSFVYTATGNEQYMTIGVFADDSDVTAVPFNPFSPVQLSYIFVDEVYVIPASTVSVTGNDKICAGESTTLTAIGQTTYAWATAAAPGTLIGNGPSVTVSPTDTTTYYVYGDTDTGSFTVNVKPTPVVNLGNDTVICDGDNLLLIAYQGGAHVAGTQYVWQNNATGPFFTPTQSGMYYVTGTLNGCTATDTIEVIMNPNPEVDLGPDRDLCSGETLVLDASTPDATYLWQDQSVGAVYTVTQAGTYSVTVTVGTCSASDEITVTGAPTPVFNLGNDIVECAGTPVTLDATVPNAVYHWQDNSAAATFLPAQSGTYWVEVTVGPCSASDSVDVLFHPLPAVDLGNDRTPCTGASVVLDATQPGLTYNWQDHSSLPVYTVTQSGTYTVTVTDANGCQSSDAVAVTFIVAPSIDFVDSVLCMGDVWLLDVTAPYAVYLWQDKSVQPTFTINHAGTYWATATNGCGSDSDTLSVEYRHCDCRVFVPNSFTPDQSGNNEWFTPIADPECTLENYTFTVFDRWGGTIFESRNVEFGWDGKVNGKAAPIGLYAYRLLYKFEKTPQKQGLGSIALVR